MKSKIDIDMNDVGSVQKGIHFYQVRAITSVVCYPIFMYILYGLWTHKNEFLDNSTREMIENSPISYIVLGYVLGGPLIRLLFVFLKILNLKKRLAELQRKSITKYQLDEHTLKAQKSITQNVEKKTLFQSIFNYLKETYPEWSFIKNRSENENNPEFIKEEIKKLYQLKWTFIFVGLVVMVLGGDLLCALHEKSQISEDLGLYVVSFLFIVGGFYLALIQPRKMEKDLNELKKRELDKTHFHSDLK